MSAILVIGATGKQGGSVIKTLLSKGTSHKILAVTRDPRSKSAQRLSKQSSNITLVQGDLDDPAGIFKNAKDLISTPIWGVFSVQAAIGNGAAEESQGKNLIDESIKQGVKYFIYSSVDRGGAKSIDNPTEIPHFIHKHRIEQHLLAKTKNGQMEWTILRPTAFFENLVPGFFGKVFATSFEMSLRARPLQFVAVSDIGYIAAQAFLQPESFKGHFLSLAGDELTYDQFAKIFKEKTQQTLPTTFRITCSLLMASMKDLGYMFKWFGEEGYGADIKEVKKIHPNVKDFGTWLETESQFATR